MPSTNNPLSTAHEKIIHTEFTEPDLNTFNEIISQLEPPSLCPTNLPFKVGSLHHEPTGEIIPCDNSIHLPLRKIAHWKKLLKAGQLGNIFNDLRSVTEEKGNELNSDSIEKLLQILDQFFGIPLTDLDLTAKKINEINKAYFDLFAGVAKLPETVLILSDNRGRDPKIFELMSLSSGYFQKLNRLNANVSQAIKQSDLPYQIYAPLKSYLKGLGNLAFNFRKEDSDADLSKFENNAVSLVNLMTNLTTNQLSTVRYTFLSQYHHEADLLSECKRLFNTNNCDPYGFNDQYDLIYKGISLRNNHLEPLVKKLLFGSRQDIHARLIDLAKTVDKNNPFDNFLDYFKAVIKEKNQKNEAISPETLADLSKLIFYSTEVLTSTKPKSKIYDSVFSLLLHLLKNPTADDQLLHLWKAIEACADQMKYLLDHPQAGIDSSIGILADIFHVANDIPTISMIEKKEMGIKIGELSIACFKIDKCSSSTLNQFSMTLGSMVRSLSKKNQTSEEKSAAEGIEKIAKRIVANAQLKIPENEFKDLAWSYLKGRYDKKVEVIDINKHCRNLFNLTNCQEFISANQTAELDIDTTTLTSKTTTVIPTVNTTLVPAINQTSSTSFLNTTTEFPVNLSNTTSNQTAVDTANTPNSDALSFGSAATLGASAAHGVGTGMLNGIIQYFETKYSRRGEQSSMLKTIATYSSPLVHAAFAATFPLMLFKIQEHINQGNEDEAQQLWDNLLLQVTPTFISTAILGGIFHVGNRWTQSFLKRLHVPAPVRSLVPLLGIANNFYYNPSETGVHLATSVATSSLTSFGLHRFFPIKNRQGDIESFNTQIRYDVQENAVEMQPLNPEKNNNDLITTVTEENLTPEEIFFKKVEFLTADQYKKLKDYLNKLIKSIKTLKDELSDQTHIDRLDQIIDIPHCQLGLHYDLIDLENFPKKFITEYNECHDDKQKTQIVKNNFDYFKTMIKTMYDKLLSDNVNSDNVKNDCLNFILCSIKETKTLKNSITNLIRSIEANLGFIRGITKPLVSIHLPQQPSPEQENLPKRGPGVLPRQDTGITHVNNRYSIHGLNNNVTRLSNASGDSSDSALSDGYGNTRFNDPEIQIKQRLLQTRLNH